MVVTTENSFGFNGFGDGPDQDVSCGGRYWANNYYDFPHNIAQAFMITGSEANIETGTAHAIHMMDLDHSSITGQSRECPGFGSFGKFTNCAIGLSGTANHYKTQGFFDWGNILAEPIFCDMGLVITEWARGFPGGADRATASVLEALSAAYAYSNDAKYLTDMHSCFSRYGIKGDTGGQRFMQAFLGEAIMWHLVEEPTYQEALDALEIWADYWITQWNDTDKGFGDSESTELRAGWFAGLAHAARIIPAKRNNYLATLIKLWTAWSENEGRSGDGKLKQFTQKFKAPPHFFVEVMNSDFNPNDPDYWGATVAVDIAAEKRQALLKGPNLLNIYPNPFRPGTHLTWWVPNVVKSNGTVTLSIFDARGKLVRQLHKSRLTTGRFAAAWDGRDNRGKQLPSGIYIASLRWGKVRKDKSLVLVR
jgi:hypothetical protein